MPDGEQYKTLKYWERILHKLASSNHHRDTTLIALGKRGYRRYAEFAAACYQRGVDFIQVPTTLLAQVDASIGDKTAVNHPIGKTSSAPFINLKRLLLILIHLTL